MLALDLGVFHRTSRTPSLREATGWTGVWVSLALLFAVGVYWFSGIEKTLEFLTGYLLEYSLSIDNIFVFILIFSYFNIPIRYQHRVLFWGIIGAVLMRGIFIIVGASLLARFSWIMFVFGAFLILSGIKMVKPMEDKIDLDSNFVVRLIRRWLPVTGEFEGHKFFIRRDGGLYATPLFLALLLVESTDVVFALDSIPAIFGVTQDPFIVYTSNIFAILGLRSLYFLLAGVVAQFRYLRVGLAGVLVFIGLKMLASQFYHIPTVISLLIIVGMLSLSILASVVINPVHDSDRV